MGPLVTIYPEEILYTRVKPEHVDEIIDETIINNRLVEKLLYKDLNSDKLCENKNQIDFYNRQSRYILKECGVIDPQSLEEYIAKDGYRAAYRAVHDMEGIDICKEIIDSNMRGRGGGGFLTGKKWELTRVEKNNKKYIICNGDEGDPGAFMDRSLMEGNPHAVIEGMIISAMGVGADEGYVYVRTEYPLAVKRMINACEVLRKNGILGKNIFGSTKNFDLTVMQGAGAFVCGEETAMIASIEGKRGMPDPKPPYPSQKGLFGKPTVINNVETFATIPNIILYGSKNF